MLQIFWYRDKIILTAFAPRKMNIRITCSPSCHLNKRLNVLQFHKRNGINGADSPVWPDVNIKSSPIFPEVAQKVA